MKTIKNEKQWGGGFLLYVGSQVPDIVKKDLEKLFKTSGEKNDELLRSKNYN